PGTVREREGPAHGSGEVAHAQQTGELRRGARHLVVDDGDVELALGGELAARREQTTLLLLGGLGAAADETLDQRFPAGRGEEDEARLRDGAADLPGTGEIDLQQHRVTGRDGLVDRTARRAIAV